jgi:hypothetical protein
MKSLKVGKLKPSDPSHSKEKEMEGSRAWKMYDTLYFLGGIITNIKCLPIYYGNFFECFMWFWDLLIPIQD